MQREKSNNTASEIDLLLYRAINGDANAFGRLYDMHVDRVYRHVYYRVGNVSDAEDLTQEVFIKAWQAIRRYKKTASPFLAWLIKISYNLVIDFYRAKKDDTFADLDVLASRSDSDPEYLAEMHLDQQQLRRAILELPGDQQKVVVMRFIEGFSYPEIASSLGKSEGAVRVILHRSLKSLKKIIEKVK